MNRSFIVICFITCTVSSAAFGHSGRTDSSGGHRNRSTGGYHFHGSAASVQYSPAPRIAYRTAVTAKPRTSYRTTVVKSDSKKENNKQISAKKTGVASKTPTRREFRTWHSADGKFSIEARFKSYLVNINSIGIVTLENKLKESDATETDNFIKVPSRQLSLSDRLYVRKITGFSKGL